LVEEARLATNILRSRPPLTSVGRPNWHAEKTAEISVVLRRASFGKEARLHSNCMGHKHSELDLIVETQWTSRAPTNKVRFWPKAVAHNRRSMSAFETEAGAS